MSDDGLTHEDESQERRTGSRSFSDVRVSVRCNCWRSKGDTKFTKDACSVLSNAAQGLHRESPWRPTR